MSTTTHAPAPLAWTRQLEQSDALGDVVDRISPTITATFGTGVRGEVLRGEWLGHALHPVLTDVVIGSWTSAVLLDLLGDEDDSRAAQRLVGIGLLAVGPTAWTGWAEWSTAGPAARRVGVVHAVTNGVAIGSFAGSWLARRRGSHRLGKGLAVVGVTALSVAGYLGGHLAHSRQA